MIDHDGGVAIPVSDETYFARIADAVLAPDGSVWVGDHGRREVLQFDGDGRLQAVIGGEGEGPGEFSGIATISWAGRDTLLVWDAGATRLHRFLESGQHRSSSRSTGALRPQFGWDDFVIAPSGVLMAKQIDRGSATPPTGPYRPDRPLIRIEPSGTLDTLRVYPGPEIVYLTGSNGIPSMMNMLLAPNAHIAAGGSPWRVVAGDGAEPTFHVWTEAGERAMTVSWTPSPAEVGPPGREDIAEARQRSEYAMVANAFSDEVIQALMDQLPPPTGEVPVYRDLFIDDLGHIWVERFPWSGVAAGTWSLFDDAGVWLGELLLPPDSRPLVVTRERLLLHRRDSLNVESLELLPIRWAGASLGR